MQEINLLDGSYLYYGRGSFDDWCVYEMNQLGSKKAPRDIDYFNELYDYAKEFGYDTLYNDFVMIYDMTTKKFDFNVVERIKNISDKYGSFNQQIFRVFSILYMGMVAEENKRNTRLGKRIKRLGMYFLLVERKNPEYCAHFMRGKKWPEIDRLCLEGGF